MKEDSCEGWNRRKHRSRQTQSVTTNCGSMGWGDAASKGFSIMLQQHGIENGMCCDTQCFLVTVETGREVVRVPR